MPYEQMLPVVTRHWPSFAALLRRLGSRQIRNLGTIGGNLGTASPIGDTLPVLLALDAAIVLQSVRGARTVPVDGFFIGYRKTILAPDAVILAVRLPPPAEGELLECAKVSKRRDQDISAVCGAFRLRLAEGVVADARLAFGGMAATPARAPGAERALRGRKFDASAIAAAAAALATDFAPLDDVRGTAAYRIAVAQGLLRRLWLRHSGGGETVEVDAL
jgi:xanthine dehydrogenase small subunit